MRDTIKSLKRPDNYPAYISFGLAVTGLLSSFSSYRIEIVLAILGLLAVNTVVERLTYFRQIMNAVEHGSGSSGLRSRGDPDFEDIGHYIRGATEVFVSALSLGFVCRERQAVIKEGLDRGVSFRFVVVNPDLPDAALTIIAEHDERGTHKTAGALKSEILDAKSALHDMIVGSVRKGTITLKAGVGMPVLTVTMVNPLLPDGKMRIEIRPFHRNNGPRPYFELKRSTLSDREWYDKFLQLYYVELWDNSTVIDLSRKP